MDLLMIRLLIGVFIAFIVGKLVSRIKLPAILGWLLTGMILGPHAVGIISGKLLDASWYQIILSIFECVIGLLFLEELHLQQPLRQLYP
jgi:predicted Kef-type K+ transport protein